MYDIYYGVPPSNAEINEQGVINTTYDCNK